MAGEAPDYCAFLARMPCCACGRRAPSCVHHHTQRRALSRRAHDRDGMPLCGQCHHDLHALTGRFKGFTRAQLRAFQDHAVEIYRVLYRPMEDEPWNESEAVF